MRRPVFAEYFGTWLSGPCCGIHFVLPSVVKTIGYLSTPTCLSQSHSRERWSLASSLWDIPCGHCSYPRLDPLCVFSRLPGMWFLNEIRGLACGNRAKAVSRASATSRGQHESQRVRADYCAVRALTQDLGVLCSLALGGPQDWPGPLGTQVKARTTSIYK